MKRIMQPKRLVGLVGLFLSVLLTRTAGAQEQAPAPLRVGAVAYSPSVVTVFDDLKRYCLARDMSVDYVLYSNYDALVQALVKGDIDVAWNTPLAHARAHLKLGGRSQTLVMRDVDCNFRSVLVVRKDAEAKQLADLKGKTLILGSRGAAEATVLPLFYLRREWAPIDRLTMLELDREFDFAGNPCSSPSHVLKALREKRGAAGIVGQRLWQSLPEDERAGLEVIWTSPAFSHCVFTARSDLDSDRARRFTEILVSMSPNDPRAANVLRLEGAGAWVPGSPKGFGDLIDALRLR